WCRCAFALFAWTRLGSLKFLSLSLEACFPYGDTHATGAFSTTLTTIGFAIVCVSFSRPVVLDHSATGACRFWSRPLRTRALRFVSRDSLLCVVDSVAIFQR